MRQRLPGSWLAIEAQGLQLAALPTTEMSEGIQMPNRHTPSSPNDESSTKLHALIANVEAHCPFGTVFLLTQLRGFVRDQCSDTDEALPLVELLMHSGETLRVCHVIGVAPRYVVLAVYDNGAAKSSGAVRAEFLSYESILRVTSGVVWRLLNLDHGSPEVIPGQARVDRVDFYFVHDQLRALRPALPAARTAHDPALRLAPVTSQGTERREGKRVRIVAPICRFQPVQRVTVQNRTPPAFVRAAGRAAGSPARTAHQVARAVRTVPAICLG